MGQDIINSLSGNPIKNGTVIIRTTRISPSGQAIDDGSEYHTLPRIPTLAEISGKYEDRFDDVRYYTGDNATG